MGWCMHLLSFFVVLLAIFLTIFTNYPSPPPSPILHQWREMGQNFRFKEYDIFYIDQVINENSTRPPLVCLHGFPTSSFDYYKMFPFLKRKFDRIVFIDFLGLGFSSKPRFHVYSIFEQADIVESVLKHIRLDRVNLFAHDYGDTVAQELLARQKENKLSFTIEKTTLTNGGIFPEVYQPLWIQKILSLPIISTILGRFHNYNTFRHHLSGVFGPNTQPSVAEFHDMWAIVRHNDGFRVIGHLLSYMDERKKFENRWVNALVEAKLPLQMIYGPKDPINPKHLFEPYFKEKLPNQRFDSLDNHIGHYPNLEAPDQVVNLLSDFMRN